MLCVNCGPTQVKYFKQDNPKAVYRIQKGIGTSHEGKESYWKIFYIAFKNLNRYYLVKPLQ